MIHPKINLLPYRDVVKQAIKKRFLIFIGISVSIGLLILGLIHFYFSVQIVNQDTRNNFLDQEITSLNTQISMIQKLKTEITAAVARKQVVENLQANRNRAVMILNQIVQPPPNVFYKTIKQNGDGIALVGLASSNTAVSALIKQFENSDVFYDPKLVESKSIMLDNTLMIEFSMTARLVNLAQLKDKTKQTKPSASSPETSASASQPVAVQPIVHPAATSSSPPLALPSSNSTSKN